MIDDIHHIRPAGRHILTIGADLIQDKYAALVELVKNAYDADSPDVEINFRVLSNNSLSIDIIDRGHGMTRETVINKWLVPSTDDKLSRKTSPNGRVMQGRKGIGRYAASILGDSLLLETISCQGEKTQVLIEWDRFINAKYLDDVDVLVNTTKTNQDTGTILTITGGPEYLKEWDESQIKKLKFELRKLINPINYELIVDEKKDDFEIFLNFYDFPKGHIGRVSESIKPFPLLELFDYRISGSISTDGKGKLNYRNQRARNTLEEIIVLDLHKPTKCGRLTFDIRVYDREVDAIDQLISRGLKDDRGDFLGRREAINLLNEFNGIGVYRNGFRIRPLGDPGFDWLELDKQRVQTPSRRIGSNQVIGFVLVESEELSSLVEKSARDGLKENTAFINLLEITKEVLIELETRRYVYRKSAGLSRTTVKIDHELKKIFTLDDLKHDIRLKLKKAGVSDVVADEVMRAIIKKESENNEIAENISQTVAIYQGQATLGKIMNVVLHEGRRPLDFFKNQIPNLHYQANLLRMNFSIEILNKSISIIDQFGTNAQVLSELFKRLDPLAAGKRVKKTELDLCKVIHDTFHVFDEVLQKSNINVSILCPEGITFSAWEQDIYAIFANLIDNSIFWLNNKHIVNKEISIIVNFNNGLQYIDFKDSGPGIEEHLIKSGVIFEPDFSTKPTGTGLGLAIAGEAATRNNLELKAFSSNTGAYFRLQPKEG